MWGAVISGGRTSNLNDTTYTIEDLNNYTVTVTVTNAAGSSYSEPITVSTQSGIHVYLYVTRTRD